MNKSPVGRPYNPELRNHLIDHAMKILLEQGLQKFSMASVAKSAHASKESLYRLFGDKEGLLHAAIERDAAFIEDVLTAGIHSNASTETKLQKIATNYLSAAYTDHAIALQRLAYADSVYGLGVLFVKKITSRVIQCVAQIFTEMGRTNPELDAEMFLGLVQGKLYNKIIFGVKPDNLQERIEQQVRVAWEIFSCYLNNDESKKPA